MPPTMTGLQWANLLFNQHCHECHKSGIGRIIWLSWARYCEDCKRKLIVPYERNKHLVSFLPKVTKKKKLEPNLHLVTMHPMGTFNINQVRALKLQWDALDPAEREQFIKDRTAEIEESREHSDRCGRFETQKRYDTKKQQEALRRQRIQSVMTKFRDLGFGPELDRHTYAVDSVFKSDRHVNQSKVLSNDEWPGIRDRYLKVFNRYRQELQSLQDLEVARERLNMARNILRKLTMSWQQDIFPFPRDFCQLPEIRAIIDAPRDTSSSTSEDDFVKSYVRQIRKAMANWRDSSHQILKGIAQEAVPFIQKKADPMNLAVGMFFSCSKCTNSPVMTYPNLLRHGCMGVRWNIPRNPKDGYHFALREAFEHSLKDSPTLNINSSINSAADLSKLVIEACGQDPRRVSPKDMDKLSTRLVCLHCAKTGFRPVMAWRTAIIHLSQNCAGKVPKLCQATQFDIEKTVEAEGSMQLGIYVCTHCRKWTVQYPTTREIMFEHLRVEHHMKEQPGEGLDYLTHDRLDTTVAKYPVWLISKKVAPTNPRPAWRWKYNYHIICDFPEDGDSNPWPKIKMI
ncbi:hypothetical protein C8Q75DRAFT_357494 [Abortiporus biennis]|nr:hypothetical protein C8Q75DRAFT_357494 [Abortiporus biennis]